MEKNYRRLKYACYSVNVTMSVVANLSPVLFLTFRELYGISYSLLGLLVFINFATQLLIDLIFSFFSHLFSIAKTVRSIPLIAIAGFLLYALWPWFCPDSVYTGLVLGTVVFSAASGLCEVLISPVIASIPSPEPEREMSKLHSVYAWGVVFVIVVSTLFLLLAGKENWQWLALLFLAVPALSSVLFFQSRIPSIETPKHTFGALSLLKNRGVWLSIFAIFLGGASECTMGQWASGYLEAALGIPKVWGDLFGVALFSVMLGLGRSLYGEKGKNVEKILVWSAVGAAFCYLSAALSPLPLLGLFACAFTGLFVSMLWPGNLVVAANRFPQGGVFIYAMMAAGGDLGASVGPQLVGVIADGILSSPLSSLAADLSLTPEQLGMKTGMLFGALFPLLGIFVFARIHKNKR